jgi:16S rRNA (guanine527-N7)-methyltransferase
MLYFAMNDPAVLNPRQIQQVIREGGLECSEALSAEIATYLQMLSKWNDRINLTAIQDSLEQLKTLFAESFLATTLVKDCDGAVLDVGSGAGFPGMAMGLYRRGLTMVLLEPRKKRAAFLAAVRRELGLDNVEIWSRSLQKCRPEHFLDLPSTVTVRGVAGVSDLVRSARHLLKEPRQLILFISQDQSSALLSNLRQVCWHSPLPIPWNPHHEILPGNLQP